MAKKILFLLIFITGAYEVHSNPNNIAPFAKVRASSELSADYNAYKVIDGIIGADGVGEWASKGNVDYWGKMSYPWIELAWNTPRWINKIILYDRPNESDHNAGVRIEGDHGFRLEVYNIPNDGSPRVIQFPSTQLSRLRFVTIDADGKNVGFSEIEVFSSPEGYSDYVSWVDPYIETIPGRFFYSITGNQPYGMIGAAPVTRNKNQGGGGYNYDGNYILGFSQLHCWMESGLDIMPVGGDINPCDGMMGWKSAYSHDDEIVQPAYHRLFLKTHRIWVEQTSTDRVSFYRYRFVKPGKAAVIVSLGGKLGNSVMRDCKIRKVSNSEIEGSFLSTDRLWGGPQNVRIYFIVRFDKPFVSMDGWDKQEIYKNTETQDSEDGGVKLNYIVQNGDLLQLKASVSFTSIGNARLNMDSECPSWDFNDVRDASRNEWNEWLGKIAVKGGTVSQRIKFYTDLWHVLLGRHKINDINGDYPDLTHGVRLTEGNRCQFKYNAVFKLKTIPKEKNGKLRFNMYNSDAFWLTMWNLNTLWGLAYPQVLDDFSASLIQYSENGGLLPRGPNLGGYSYIMSGCPATSLITSAFQRGICKKWDIAQGYAAMKRNHLPGGMMSFNEDDKMRFYIKNGYAPEQAGYTIQWSFEDWALSQMAEKLGKKKDALYFLRRSKGWDKLFNRDLKLILPKNEKGEWTSTNPFDGKGFVESDSWQATFGVSHDLSHLSALMGGNDSLCAKLDFAFCKAQNSNFFNQYVNYSNEPGLSSAHVFAFARQPWKTQYWVRQVGERSYGGITPDKGYGGCDEDQGQMGALSALMSMGLFSINGGSEINPSYEITSPVFDEVCIKLDTSYYHGKEFKIITHNNSSQNYYIQKAKLNGTDFNSFLLSNSEFTEGGVLELWLGDVPNMKWGINQNIK
ncbi:MAG: GH92 family glycosyl hydrolase [Bacteroidota bacterium]|nr:GH92 family glycosyl hydrolase [Bacteroidota bacterium]